MSETAHPLSVAMASCVAYGEHLARFADFLEETTREDAEDGRRWCKLLMPALNELHDISRVVESYMSVLAVVGGASVNDACTAAKQTYYLTRRAFTTNPHTSKLIESFSAPEIGRLRNRPIHEVFEDLEFFGGAPTFWQSWQPISRQRSKVDDVLRDAAADWSLFFRSVALAIATHAQPDLDVASWSLRLLEDIGDARVQIKQSLDTTIRYASEIGIKNSEITRVSKVGAKGVRKKLSKEQIAEDKLIAAAIPRLPGGQDGQIVALAYDGAEVVAILGGGEIARGDTYADVLHRLARRRDKVSVLVVRDGVIGFDMAAPLMARYSNLRSIRFDPAPSHSTARLSA